MIRSRTLSIALACLVSFVAMTATPRQSPAQCAWPSAPAAVANVNGFGSCYAIYLTWQSGTGAGGADDFVVTNLTTNATVVTTIPSADMTGLAPGRTYSFQIVARNCMGSSAPTPYSYSTWSSCPSIPQLVSATQGTAQSPYVNLTFTYTNNGLPATGFKVYTRFTGEANTEQYQTINPNPGVRSISVYCDDAFERDFAITAYNTTGSVTTESDKSNWALGWPQFTPIPPVPPGPQSLLGPVGNVAYDAPVRFRWFPAQNARRYNLQVATDPAFPSASIAYSKTGISTQEAGSLNWYNETSTLQPSQLYYWRVQPVSGLGETGAWAPIPQSFTLKPLALTAPVAGALLTPGSQTTVQWSYADPVKIELFADATIVNGQLQGPSIVLNPSASGGQATVTLPSDISSTRARIQVSHTLTNQAVEYAYEASPITIAPVPYRLYSYTDIASPLPSGQNAFAFGTYWRDAHVVYSDDVNHTLKHAVGASGTGTWQIETLTESGQYGTYPSVATDGAGTMHVAYFETTTPGQAHLRYRSCSSTGAWSHPVTVATVGNVEGNCSITVGAAGTPAIAVSTGSAGGHLLRVYRLAGLVWSQLGADIPCSTPTRITLKTDTSNFRYWMTFLDQGGARMNVWMFNSFMWLPVPYTAVPGPFTAVGIALDQQAYAHVAFAAAGAVPGSQKLLYMHWGGSGFEPIQTLDASLGTISDLAVGAREYDPRIAYVGNGAVKSAERSYGGPWTVGTVDIAGIYDGQVSLGVSQPDERWIQYRSTSNNALRTARPYFFTPIANLIRGMGKTTAVLDWTTTSDGQTAGTPFAFDLRYSTSPITSANFDQAPRVNIQPPPTPTGEVNCYEMSNLTPCTTYWFAIKALNYGGNPSEISNVVQGAARCTGPQVLCNIGGANAIPSPPTGEDAASAIPGAMELGLRGSNPSGRAFEIAFGIPASQQGDALRLAVFDVTGRAVRQIRSELAEAGRFSNTWDLADGTGARVSPGMYFIRLSVGGEKLTRSVLVIGQ